MNSLDAFIPAAEAPLVPPLWNIIVQYVGGVKTGEWKGKSYLIPFDLCDEEIELALMYSSLTYAKLLIGTISGLHTCREAFNMACLVGNVNIVHFTRQKYANLVRSKSELKTRSAIDRESHLKDYRLLDGALMGVSTPKVITYMEISKFRPNVHDDCVDLDFVCVRGPKLCLECRRA